MFNQTWFSFSVLWSTVGQDSCGSHTHRGLIYSTRAGLWSLSYSIKGRAIKSEGCVLKPGQAKASGHFAGWLLGPTRGLSKHNTEQHARRCRDPEHRNSQGTEMGLRGPNLHHQTASRCRWSSCLALTGRWCWPAPPVPMPPGLLKKRKVTAEPAGSLPGPIWK